MTYTPGLIRKLLADYQRLAQGAHMRPPEDRLGTRPPPLDEAPYAATARLKSDLEQALRSLPFERMQILFMTICLGESSWRHVGNSNGDGETKRFAWRKRIGEWWGSVKAKGEWQSMTPADVNKMNGESIQEITDILNGVAFDNDPVDESILA